MINLKLTGLIMTKKSELSVESTLIFKLLKETLMRKTLKLLKTKESAIFVSAPLKVRKIAYTVDMSFALSAGNTTYFKKFLKATLSAFQQPVLKLTAP